MQLRTLGTQGLETSALGLGTMGMTMAYGAGRRRERIATIRRAFELGVTLFDTAELYGGGTGATSSWSARPSRGFRDEMTIATKFGFDMSGPDLHGRDCRPEHIREVTENSLRYLGTDYIDVLYQHRVDPDVPIEEVAGAVGELIERARFASSASARPARTRSAARTRSSRCPCCRPILDLRARGRAGDPAVLASWASASSPTRRSAVAFSPVRSNPRASTPTTTCAAGTTLAGRELRAERGRGRAS